MTQDRIALPAPKRKVQGPTGFSHFLKELLMTADTVARVNPRLRRMVFSWFDFALHTSEKSALLQNFPRVAELLMELVPGIELDKSQPKGKEALCEYLATVFVSTLSETEQIRVRHDPDLPKHYKQTEMDEFLKAVRVSCHRSSHRPAFS